MTAALLAACHWRICRMLIQSANVWPLRAASSNKRRLTPQPKSRGFSGWIDPR
jgi:hypothetical protein